MIKRYVSDDTIAKKYGASDYPAVVFFRNRVPAIYDGRSDLQIRVLTYLILH